MLHILSILLYILHLTKVLAASELPATVQFDIVFPRNYTTCRQVYHFTFIFAPHGDSRVEGYSLEENLFIVPTNHLVNTTFTNFKLIVRLGFSENCGDDGYVLKEERLNFNFKKVKREVPDMIGHGCAVPVAALQVEKEIPLMPPNGNETCAVLNPALQPVKNCAFKIYDTVADKVAARMLNESRCEGQS